MVPIRKKRECRAFLQLQVRVQNTGFGTKPNKSDNNNNNNNNAKEAAPLP
jgi:hypothetical protein